MSNINEALIEADIMRNIGGSKHVTRLLDIFIEEPYAYLVMEYNKGSRLGYFKKGKIYEPKKAVQITIKILEGIRSIHECGFLHCDLTPHNVLILHDNPESIKIIDFGSSVQKNESGEYKGTHKGATKWYRPPELKKGPDGFSAHIDNSSDLYSCACICLYLLTGKAPFRKKESYQLVRNEKLRMVLKKAVRRNKRERYQTADELIKALQPFA